MTATSLLRHLAPIARCEYHDGCSNKDLDIFFEDFEDADYIAFFTPVYNNFFPAPIKAILDRFQRYYNARYKRGSNPPN